MEEAKKPKHHFYIPLVEVLGVFAALILIFKAMLLMGGSFGKYLPIVVPLVWIYVPILILLLKNRDFTHYGLSVSNWKSNVLLALVVTAVVIPVFVCGYFIFHGTILGRDIHPSFGLAILWSALSQLIVIAFPEEIFFRGYVQTRLDDLFGKKLIVFGTAIGWSVVITSILFAVGHLIIKPHWFRAFVFFPSLLFGWMRERSGSVVSSGLFHGLANITILILET